MVTRAKEPRNQLILNILEFRTGFFLALSLMGCLSGQTWADDYHYRSTLIGERGAGLGGAYTALSDDPSGVYYNPAGIVFGFENYISGSANTYTTSKTVYKQVVAGQDYTYNSSSFSPSFIGFSQSIGKQKLAFAILVPSYDLLDQNDTLSNISSTSGKAGKLLRRYYNQNITYSGGPAYSVALGERTSLGISLLAYAKTNVVINTQLIEVNPTPSGNYFIQESYLNENYYGLIPILGLQFMPTSKLSLGITVQKRVNLSGGSSLRNLSSSEDSSGVPLTQTGSFSHDFTSGQVTLNTGVVSPWQVSLGGAYFFSKALLVAADVIYYTPDNNFNQFITSSTLNGSIGAEWYLTDGLALRGGIFTDAANTPQVSSSQTNQSAHVDLYGASLSFSLIKSGSSFTLGASYSGGAGQGQAFSNTTAVQVVNQSQTSVYLAGSYQI